MQMKQLLTILFIGLSNIIAAQPSWVNLEFQTDSYGSESTWEIYMVGSDSAFASGGPYADSSYTEQLIPLPSGEYNLVVNDQFGDGICCQFGEGWFKLNNDCGLDLSVFDFNTAQITVPFMLEPCALPVPGCTNDESNNYNPWATVDNGTCNVSECPEGQAFVSMELTLDNWPNETGFTLVDLAVGQFYEQVLPGGFNFGDQLSTYTYDFCVALGFELILTDTYGDGLNGSSSGGQDGGVVITACDEEIVWELEDLAYSENDGMVHYSGPVFVEPCAADSVIVGCMNDDYVDYNPLATAQDTCEVLHTWGCMDSTAFNYDSIATISDLNSPCLTTIRIGDAAGDGWGNSHIGVKQGNLQWIFTMGPGQFSQSWDLVLDSDEKVDVYYFEIGSPQQPPQETEFQTLHNSILVTNELEDTLMVEGLNPFFDNGQGALQPFKNPEWNVYSFTPYCGTSCIPFLYGCTDSLAFNFNPDVNSEDGTCYYNPGCDQAGYLEYYTQGFEADYDDGSCQTLAVFGCTNQDALNYEPEANVDNNSCVAIVEGCMDLDAYNYNEEANTSTDCFYDAGCITGPGEPYWLNDQCYAWVISVDPYCCEVSWDEVCVEMYGYCGDGITNVPTHMDQVRVYPNPTRDYINVQAPEGTLTTVYSSTGQKVLMTADTQIELPAAGVYTVVINYKNRVFKQTIVKQ